MRVEKRMVLPKQSRFGEHTQYHVYLDKPSSELDKPDKDFNRRETTITKYLGKHQASNEPVVPKQSASLGINSELESGIEGRLTDKELYVNISAATKDRLTRRTNRTHVYFVPDINIAISFRYR